MTGPRRRWIGLGAMMAALAPVTAAAGVSFATPSGLPALPPLFGVACPSATTCFAVGGVSNATVVSTSDGGRTWTTVTVVGLDELDSVSCFSATHCVATGVAVSAGAVAVTRDGHTWMAVAAVPAGPPLVSVSCVAGSHCLALGTSYSASAQRFTSSAVVSTDGGATWSATAAPTNQGTSTLLNRVQCATAQRCFVVGGGMWVSNDFGASWQDASPPNGCPPGGQGFCLPAYSDLAGLAFMDASHGVVVGGEQCGGQGVTQCASAYFSTSDAGVSWRMWPAPNGRQYAFLKDVSCSGDPCLVGSDTFTSSSILQTSDGTSLASVGSTTGTVNTIVCASGGPCVAVGKNGGAGILQVSAVGINPRASGGTAVSHPVTTPAASGGGGNGSGGAGAANAVVSSFSTSLPTPAAVASSATALLLSALLVLALVLLVVFPSQLFNRTYDENHDRIRAWWERRLPSARARRERAQSRAMHGAVALAVAVLVGAVLGTLLDPAAGFNARSAALFAGIVLSFVFSIALGAAVTAAYRRARHRGTGWELRALPSGLVVAAACVLVSRVVGFQPGYLYGIIGGIAFAGALPRRDEGHLVALSAAVTLLVAVLAWLLWVPVSNAAVKPGAGFGMALLANVLSALFVGGLAGVVLGLVPLRFLPGEKLAAWHWGAWAAVFGVAMFGLVQIMLRPQSSSAHVTSVPLWTTVGLFLAFGAASVAFWGYFRATAERETPAR
ncbi:MAG: glycoside hydrolase [Candidatus Dormibacteraeota bacterium]|nr:glycoside hydrolase [Candidatus Dormibacteraeota bacterium]